MVPQTVFEKVEVITLVGKKKGMGKLKVTVGEFKADYKPGCKKHGTFVPSSVKRV